MNQNPDISLKAIEESLDAAACARLGSQVQVRMRPLVLEQSAEQRCAASSGRRSVASVVQPPGAIGECEDPRLALRLYLRSRDALPEFRDGKPLCGFRLKSQVIELEFEGTQPRVVRPCFDLAELEPAGREHAMSLLVCLAGSGTLSLEGQGAPLELRPGQLVLVPADALLAIAPTSGASRLSFLHAPVDYES